MSRHITIRSPTTASSRTMARRIFEGRAPHPGNETTMPYKSCDHKRNVHRSGYECHDGDLIGSSKHWHVEIGFCAS
eukprot:1195667-Prorocentrum_minimum.AAC.21